MNGTYLSRISAPPNNKLHELGVIKNKALTDYILNAKWFGTSQTYFGQYMPYLKMVWVRKPLQRRYKPITYCNELVFNPEEANTTINQIQYAGNNRISGFLTSIS